MHYQHSEYTHFYLDMPPPAFGLFPVSSCLPPPPTLAPTYPLTLPPVSSLFGGHGELFCSLPSPTLTSKYSQFAVPSMAKPLVTLQGFLGDGREKMRSLSFFVTDKTNGGPGSGNHMCAQGMETNESSFLPFCLLGALASSQQKPKAKSCHCWSHLPILHHDPLLVPRNLESSIE